ncbi:unnamed protein product [Cylindrotheca closterium]|uniref:Ionotropic glutamate receptor C-terminal domain-containing protein n=1 Tax=Cylindrotheca closterium TaxID=2856 RepID=A0AAD2G3F9_9STRA|nr:unnamed protein product [Cylindrotheca closterium]
MQLSHTTRALLLVLLLIGILSVEGGIDWQSIPEGVLVGPGVGSVDVTDFCDVVRDTSRDLNDALRGRNLSIAVQYGAGFDFFQYDPDEELSFSNPGGMVASILDELAKRAGFSWRNSFVAYTTNTTDTLFGTGRGKWDNMLNWTTSNFDLSVDKWFLTTARLESEIVFLHSWFDATLILVDQGDVTDFNLFGFAAPFDRYVWLCIVATIVFSAGFMMFIDHMERGRNDRSWNTWIGDHLYLSNMAFSQNFTYDTPRSGAGRIFLSTFSFWSMLIGATYTANLASLLVENALASSVDSVKAAMDADLSICIHDGSASQTIMTVMYPSIAIYDKVIKTSTPLEMYEKLATQQCDILVGTRQEFQILSVQEKYGCKLVKAGPEIQQGSASFAIKFDPLSCDSVLAYVLNIHLHAMSIDGNMTKYWDSYIDGIDGTCANKEELQTSRRLEMEKLDSVQEEEEFDLAARRLKGGGGGSSESSAFIGGSTEDGAILQMKGMAGVFFIHGLGTAVALILVLYTQLRRKYIKAPKLKRKEHEESLKITKSLTKKPVDADLHRKYEHLKRDFMTQLDDLFEQHLEAKQISQNSSPYVQTSTPYEAETASEQSIPSWSDSPSMSQTSLAQRRSRSGMDVAARTGGDAKAEAMEYHRSSRNLINTNDSTGGVIHTIGMGRTIGSGREEKMDVKTYHKESGRGLTGMNRNFADNVRNLTNRNQTGVSERGAGGPDQTMGMGREAKMKAKAYHKDSRRNPADINESIPRSIRNMTDDINESLRSL